jgi:short-subunit dehydrogenase
MADNRKVVVVTGASSGFGRLTAEHLARHGFRVFATMRDAGGRNADRARALRDLADRESLDLQVAELDVDEDASVDACLGDVVAAAGRVDVLVNNAGFGTQDPFLDIPWERTREQLQLNVVSLTELCWLFGGSMRSRGRGHILNVASTGAYQPVPHYATYSAGKTYVRNFSEALAFELAPEGVRVCCLCPGPTATEFTEVAGHRTSSWQSLFFMSASRCARIGLRSLFGWRRNVVSGYANKLQCFFMRFVPRRAQVWGAALVMAKPTTALVKSGASGD